MQATHYWRTRLWPTHIDDPHWHTDDPPVVFSAHYDLEQPPAAYATLERTYCTTREKNKCALISAAVRSVSLAKWLEGELHKQLECRPCRLIRAGCWWMLRSEVYRHYLIDVCGARNITISLIFKWWVKNYTHVHNLYASLIYLTCMMKNVLIPGAL